MRFFFYCLWPEISSATNFSNRLLGYFFSAPCGNVSRLLPYSIQLSHHPIREEIVPWWTARFLCLFCTSRCHLCTDVQGCLCGSIRVQEIEPRVNWDHQRCISPCFFTKKHNLEEDCERPLRMLAPLSPKECRVAWVYSIASHRVNLYCAV
jgi:hypothetical protein